MPDAMAWKEKAVTLRQSATQQGNPLERRTLLMLAEDCEAIAAALESQAQPGKPKPPGNPPRPPDREGGRRYRSRRARRPRRRSSRRRR